MKIKIVSRRFIAIKNSNLHFSAINAIQQRVTKLSKHRALKIYTTITGGSFRNPSNKNTSVIRLIPRRWTIAERVVKRFGVANDRINWLDEDGWRGHCENQEYNRSYSIQSIPQIVKKYQRERIKITLFRLNRI